MSRSPKLLIFLTIFIDLLGFGIIIPILAPTSAEFLNKFNVERAVRAVSGGSAGVEARFDNAAKIIELSAADAASLDAARADLTRRLVELNFPAEGIRIESPAADGGGAGGGVRFRLPEKTQTRNVGFAAGILMTAFSLLQMLLSPLWGRLSDRYGRRPILLISLFGSTLSYVLFAVSRSYGLLLFSRMLAGGMAANITAAQAYIADITTPEDRTKGFTLIGMAFGLGFALGPVFGGGATHFWHWLHPDMLPSEIHVGPGVVAAAICGVNFIWAVFRLPESLPRERRGTTHFRRFATVREAVRTLNNPIVGPLIMLMFLVTFAFSNVEISFSLYAKSDLGLDARHIYALFVFIGLVMAFTQGFLVRRLIKRVAEHDLMIWGAAILVVGLVLLPVWTYIPAMLVALGILSVGQGMCQPSILSLISRHTAAETQGNVFGTNQAASALARIVGPLFGGLLYELGHALPFWAAAAIMAGSIGWARVARERLIEATAAQPEAPA
jgi:MFS family permease